jgi:hypothetical protein
MVTASQALSAIPGGLRTPLISEYQSIVQNFLEHRWLPSEHDPGRSREEFLSRHAQEADELQKCLCRIGEQFRRAAQFSNPHSAIAPGLVRNS